MKKNDKAFIEFLNLSRPLVVTGGPTITYKNYVYNRKTGVVYDKTSGKEFPLA